VFPVRVLRTGGATRVMVTCGVMLACGVMVTWHRLRPFRPQQGDARQESKERVLIDSFSKCRFFLRQALACVLLALVAGGCSDLTESTTPADTELASATSDSASDLSSTTIQASLPFLQISQGDSHTCAITTDNQVYCWGNNGAGQLGTERKPIALLQGSWPGVYYFARLARTCSPPAV